MQSVSMCGDVWGQKLRRCLEPEASGAAISINGTGGKGKQGGWTRVVRRNSIWRQRILARAGFLRLRIDRLENNTHDSNAKVNIEKVKSLVKGAEKVANSPHILFPAAGLERAWVYLHEAEVALLPLLGAPAIQSHRTDVLAKGRRHLEKDDPRLKELERLVRRAEEKELSPSQQGSSGVSKDVLINVLDAAYQAEDAELARVRSLKNLLWIVTLFTCIGLIIFSFWMWTHPSALLLCFKPTPAPSSVQPQVLVVCPSQEYIESASMRLIPPEDAKPSDITSVGIAGLAGAALTVILSLRRVPGSSAPYSLSVAAATLKLPTGVVTAILGIVLIAGGFVPGFSNVDSRAQLLAWAVIFGASQHLVTRLVDRRAQKTLSQVSPAGVPEDYEM